MVPDPSKSAPVRRFFGAISLAQGGAGLTTLLISWTLAARGWGLALQAHPARRSLPDKERE
jgi:hypothetical protein